MLSAQLQRRLSRLRAVSTAEIIHRTKYKLFCAAERRGHRSGTLSAPDRLRSALVRSIGTAADWRDRLVASRIERRSAFFSGTADRKGMLALFDHCYAAEKAAAISSANEVLEGTVSFFGKSFPLRNGAWNLDPVTLAEWPRRYHRDVPIHGGNNGFGDVKYVWELNRHQFLTDLGRAYFLTGDDRYARKATSLISDWVADNPYATGVNWACALEPAFRVFSWLWTYHLCQEHLRDADRDAHLVWLTAFYDHGRFLHRHLEHYASPFNHLIGEAAALYMTGVLFPEFSESPQWRRRGREVLESEVGRQFYADGGSVEQSTFYHHATLGFYTLAALLGRRNGEEFSPQVWKAIERGIDFSAALVQPDGFTPAIGGADDGKPLRLEHTPWWDFRAFQAIGSVVFDRTDFKHVAQRFPEDALWLLGAEGLRTFGTLEATEPALNLALPASGYYVLRSDRSQHADYVCVDCGEQAGQLRTDAVPNSVHGHADCLSIVASLRGRRVLVDSGVYCYNGSPEWVGHFRRTAAHNTVRIDARDQALYLGGMAWSHTYTPSAEVWSTAAEHAAFMGSHDGYMRRGGDTIHRRLVWLRPDSYLIVYDEFECANEHNVELNFQFAPEPLQIIGPGHACFGSCVRVGWTASSSLDAQVHEGGTSPEQGWIAPSLGVRVPAPRLTLTGRFGNGGAVLSLFAAPRASGIDVSALPSDGTESGYVFSVSDGTFHDVVAAPAIGMQGAPGSTDGRVAVWRVSGNQVAGAWQIGGTFVR